MSDVMQGTEHRADRPDGQFVDEIRIVTVPRRDPDWWLPLSIYRDTTRAHVERLQSEGRNLTFRGLRHIYRAARDGVFYVKPETRVPAHQST